MAAVTITVDDLAPFASIDYAKAQEMIADAMAVAALDAPCILAADFEHEAAAKAIIRGAILRWHDAGSGAFSQTTTGPFGVALDTRVRRESMFSEGEIGSLKQLCTGETAGAFSVDTIGAGVVHAETCALFFGATYCSCGADIAGFPLWEP